MTAALPVGLAPGGRGSVRSAQPPRAAALVRVVALLVALALVVGVRVALNGSSVVSALAAGSVFGVALMGVASSSARRRIARPRVGSIALGALGGALLIVLPGLASGLPAIGVGLHPQPFAAWAIVTVVVAVGEEAVLRGVLFDAVVEAAGRPAAVAVTSVAFALIHVPLYGWHVVPLDLAVGVALAGLRLISRGVAAPAMAHVVADLATWWM
jgi:membrane protease YdiL (CAAX protease family)